MNRLPAAIFIVDVKKEHIALAEAKLKHPRFAMVDAIQVLKALTF